MIDFSKPLCVIFLQAYACVRVCIHLYACMHVLPSVSLLIVDSGEQCGVYGARATAPGGRTRGQLCDKHTRCGRLYLALRGEGTHKCDVVLSHVLCCLVSGTHILTSELIPVLEKSKSPRVVRVRHGYERRGREGERREGEGRENGGEGRRGEGGEEGRGRRMGGSSVQLPLQFPLFLTALIVTLIALHVILFVTWHVTCKSYVVPSCRSHGCHM